MRTLILTGLLLGSTAVMARDMFVVVHTRDNEVDVYRCNTSDRVDDSGVRERRVLRSAGGAMWHAVGGVAPYSVIARDVDHGGISITVMDATGNIATGYGMITTRYNYIQVSCPDDDCPAEATPLSIPKEKKPKDPAKARTSGTGPAHEPRPLDPERMREPVQPRKEESAFEVRPSRERPAPAPAPPPTPPPAPVRSVQRSR